MRPCRGNRLPPRPEIRWVADRAGAGEPEGSSRPSAAGIWGRSAEELFAHPLQALPQKPATDVGEQSGLQCERAPRRRCGVCPGSTLSV